MPADPNFLNAFQQSITRLQELGTNIKNKNPTQNKNFNSELLAKLTAINQKIKELETKIQDVASQINTFSSEMELNSKQVAEAKKQMVDLQKQITDLETLKNQMEQEIQTSKATIDTLTSENAAIKAEMEAKGTDLQKQHAEAISMAAQEAEQKNAAQLAKIKELQDQIVANQTEIDRLNQEVAQHTQTITDHTATQTQLNEGRTQLEQQKADLEAQNQDLANRIASATLAITEITEIVQNIVDIIPDESTNTQVNELLQSIDQSIDNINGQLQGRGVPGKIEVNTQSGSTKKMDLAKILQILGQQMQSRDANVKTKVQTALQFINQNKMNQEDISKYLKDNNFKFGDNNNNVTVGGGYPDSDDEYEDSMVTRQKKLRPSTNRPYPKHNPNEIRLNDFDDSDSDDEYGGGRKRRRTRKMRRSKRSRRTRKLRKQKGGFTYTKRTKRTKIVTKTKPTTTSRRRSSTKSTKSSRRSSK
jgi:chromosome segregation ATPase